jgi:co-chaperonin GroES (HSP10)
MSEVASEAHEAAVFTDIPSLGDRRVVVKPCGDKVLVERQDDLRQIGHILLPFSNRFDVQMARVLAVGPRVQDIKPGMRVAHVRVIGLRVDDRELRARSGRKLWMMESKDCLAYEIEGVGLQPTRDRVLLKLAPAKKTLPSGLEVVQDESTLVQIAQVLAVGPKVQDVDIGDLVLHHRVKPVRIDDPEVITKYGDRLGILYQKDCEAKVEFTDGEPLPKIEGYARVELTRAQRAS